MPIPRLVAGLTAALFGVAVVHAQPAAPTWPAPQEHDFVLKDFRFRSGERLAELKIHYRTLGAPRRDAQGHVVNAVMVLHGTGGDGATFLRPEFAGALFQPGGLLDASRYFIILPDGVGHGASSKPSDGLHARFPRYGYEDMVEAQHALVAQGLGVERLRLLMGTSMGCMHAFLWVEHWPKAVQAAMPLACLPVPIAGRNRVWRKMAMDSITSDPSWAGGEYKTQPVAGLRGAIDLVLIAGAAPLRMQRLYPTRDAADAYARQTSDTRLAETDANDMLYALDASRDYDPSQDLEKIAAPLTWVNSGDDFINPPELGVAEQQARRIAKVRFVLVPASPETYGHGTHTVARFWQDQLADLLRRSEAPGP